MKKVLSLIVAGVVIFAQTGFTAEKTYTVSATVPIASSVGINAFSVNSVSGARTAVAGTALSFDPLLYQANLGIYLPDHYFIIESSLASGAGNQNVVVTYTEGANPNAPGHGLGWKTVATFNKVVGNTESQIAGHSKKMLKDLAGAGVTITGAQLGTALLKLYVGVVTGDPALGEPAGSEVISNADTQGLYDGSLKITATVV